MKILAISDLHGMLPDITVTGDVLVIAGDICPATDHTYAFQRQWLTNVYKLWCQKLIDTKVVKHVVYCSGNHDWYFEHLFNYEKEVPFIMDFDELDNIIYLRDREVIIDGIRFYGTPWTPNFCSWAFNRNENSLKDIFSRIPEGIDVLISHGPPYGYCDTVTETYQHPVTGDYLTKEGQHLGSKALNVAIKDKKPKWSFTGHIHTGNHKPMKMCSILETGTHDVQVVNVSYLDETYKPMYQPFVCEV